VLGAASGRYMQEIRSSWAKRVVSTWTWRIRRAQGTSQGRARRTEDMEASCRIETCAPWARKAEGTKASGIANVGETDSC
jgi:hypothetical protein